MPSKDDLIKQLKNFAKGSTPQPNEWEQKLHDFLDALKDGFPDVFGAVEPASVAAPVMHLVLWPKYRPLETSYMVSVVLRGDRAVVLGAQHHECRTPDDLWIYLASLLSLDSFRQTLMEYRRRNEAPVSGFLRTGNYNQLLDADVAVEVKGAVVKRIADRKKGPFEVGVLGGSNWGKFDSTMSYRFLTVAGFVVEVQAVDLGPSSGLRVSGALRDDLLP